MIGASWIPAHLRFTKCSEPSHFGCIGFFIRIPAVLQKPVSVLHKNFLHLLFVFVQGGEEEAGDVMQLTAFETGKVIRL